jgi:hypothetical protein
MMAFTFACGAGMCFMVILVEVVCEVVCERFSAGMLQVRFESFGDIGVRVGIESFEIESLGRLGSLCSTISAHVVNCRCSSDTKTDYGLVPTLCVE